MSRRADKQLPPVPALSWPCPGLARARAPTCTWLPRAIVARGDQPYTAHVSGSVSPAEEECGARLQPSGLDAGARQAQLAELHLAIQIEVQWEERGPIERVRLGRLPGHPCKVQRRHLAQRGRVGCEGMEALRRRAVGSLKQ